MKPFLLQHAQDAESNARADPASNYYFDPEDDLLHWKEHPDKPPAIEMAGENGPQTKKKDVEKSDDSKDRGIWM
ncbi:hypothetical protein ACFR99_01540 [Haloarchaeobius amylolyticus]|uniref:Uncharacterized protein n=1 Tax=Haloarchaeobius amylolyticus TaxID=1198296 RepID=A0ABD6BBW8_9EURY